MADNQSIRQFKAGDEEKIVKLLEIVFKDWPHFDLPCSPLDHWRWKYRSNHPENNIICVAEEDEKIIGCNHGQYTNIKIGGRIIKSQQGVDTAVHPDFRGLGIHKRIDSMKEELYEEQGVEFIYFASNNPIIIKVDLKLGSKPFPYPITRLMWLKEEKSITRNIQNTSYIRRLKIRVLLKAAKFINHIERLLIKLPKVNSGSLIVSDLEIFDERFNSLWDREKGNYSFIKDRTYEYLNWRYRDPRGGEYTVKQATENGNLLGYIVLRVNRYKPDQVEGYIVDLLTPINRSDCFEALISEAMKFFDHSSVDRVYYCGVTGHPYVNLLKRHEFLDIHSHVNIYYSVKKDYDDFTQFRSAPPRRLLFHLGDIDWI